MSDKEVIARIRCSLCGDFLEVPEAEGSDMDNVFTDERFNGWTTFNIGVSINFMPEGSDRVNISARGDSVNKSLFLM